MENMNNNMDYLSPKYKEDRYSDMVRMANINPFNLTVEPLLNRELKFGNMIPIFTKELNSTVPHMLNRGYSELAAVEAYAFNMVESYYNHAGFVPKAMVDVIVEQIYIATNQTIYAGRIGSIDDFKYKLYWDLTHQ